MFEGRTRAAPISDSLKSMFRLYAVVAFLIGLPLLLFPGRFLDTIGWAPYEPVLGRVTGAALLALSWGSVRGSRASTKAEAAVLIEVEAIFCFLGSLGLLRHMLVANYPDVVRVAFAVLVLSAIGWAVFWLT